MTEGTKQNNDKSRADKEQSDTATEANKPDNARAKGEPEAGNILGGVQPG